MLINFSFRTNLLIKHNLYQNGCAPRGARQNAVGACLRIVFSDFPNVRISSEATFQNLNRNLEIDNKMLGSGRKHDHNQLIIINVDNSSVSNGKPRHWHFSETRVFVLVMFLALIGFVWETETLVSKCSYVFEMVAGRCKYHK